MRIVSSNFMIAHNTLIILMLMAFLPATMAADTLTDFNGNTNSIDSFAGNGKWLVVMLWASDCHVCNEEVHQYVQFHKSHSAKDATVLGVSLDGKAKKTDAESFLKEHNVNFPNLIAEPQTVANMYQSLTGTPWVGTPSFLVYSPKGELIGAQVGAVPPEIIESFIARESNVAQN